MQLWFGTCLKYNLIVSQKGNIKRRDRPFFKTESFNAKKLGVRVERRPTKTENIPNAEIVPFLNKIEEAKYDSKKDNPSSSQRDEDNMHMDSSNILKQMQLKLQRDNRIRRESQQNCNVV